MHFHFKTKELTTWQKFLQVYWINPNSWLLEELTIENGQVTIIKKNGDVFKSKKADLRACYSVDNYHRKEFQLEGTLGNKTKFKEIPYMLDGYEWEEIAIILNAEETKKSKVFSFMATILGRR